MYNTVVIGKFWPFHLGHDLLIRSALMASGVLTVIISNDTIEKNAKVASQMNSRYFKDIFVENKKI